VSGHNVPSCDRHDGDSMRPEECEACEAWCNAEEAYWRLYFGHAVQGAREQARFEREEYGRVLTDDERMDEGRRLKS
jgi:hypothetical protein